MMQSTSVKHLIQTSLKISSYVMLCLSLYTTSFAADPPAKTEEQKTLYAVGQLVARSLSVFNLTPAELELVKEGLTDSILGKKPEVEIAAYNAKVQELAKARRKKLGDKLAVIGKDFLEKAALEKGAVKTASGLVYISKNEGTGASPNANDIVKVNYRGTLPDGTEFDSSYKRGKPLEFKLSDVIKCWIEGVQKMKPGGKATLVCPSELAYGEKGAGELILPGATLAFEIELLEVKQAVATKPGGIMPAKPAETAPPVNNRTDK